MSGSLFAHIADELHEHAPSGEIVWHHAAPAPEAQGFSPLLFVVGAIVLLVVTHFVVQRLRATRPTTAMRSTSP